ncbi:putative transferase family protein [Diaporthe ampelina]|uniref:Putative transferase family protein n=1 Tax=Diaporthe ampelina TaxID=1214573 RepID=A0A0G2F607_9PEZI|nr:putative transferase family protein [Diaporthe ampelina]
MASEPPSSRVISRQRVFPARVLPAEQATVTRLSIVDASVARFSTCAAVWLYNSTGTSQDSTLHLDRLRQALRENLDDYRHFAGQLRWATKDDIQPGDPNPRHVGRPLVSCGTPTDPGVELVYAEYDRPLGEIVPSALDRRTARKTWVATDFPQDELLPRCKLAFNASLAEFEGLPSVAVQLTRFSCGGWAVGVMLSHCLADALCLLRFVHAWAERSQVLVAGGGPARLPKPVFEPGLLDQHAGLRGSPEPDAEKIALARSLPMHRYDWWATDAPGYPAWVTASSDATKTTPEDQEGMKLSPSTFPPWPTWNMSAPVEHVQIRFGADEVARIKRAAQATLPESKHPIPPVSRLDSVLAHMWILINRARRHHTTQEQVYLDITLGLRGRVSPPLPDSFAGSPILLGHVSRRGSDVAGVDGIGLGAIALEVRKMMALFTPRAVAAYLHDAAHEVSPQRLWQCFLGERHTLVTSWLRAGAYEVDFCGGDGGTRPVYVQGKMPRMDGVLQMMDVGEGAGDFDVSLCLERGAMGRLLADGLLRKYER